MKKLTTIVLSLAVIAGIVGVTYLMFGNSDAEAREGPQNFVVALQGTASGVETSPGVFCFEVDMVDPSTGRVIGVGTDCLDTGSIDFMGDDGDFFGGFSIINTTTFNLSGGAIVSESRTKVDPIIKTARGLN